jgi:hypothetical protein
MFGKSDQQRIDDTLTLISDTSVQDAPYLTRTIRIQIAKWVDTLYPAMSHNLSRSMSVRAKIAHNVPKGDEQQRGLRRAIVLLWTAIGQQQGLQGLTAPRATEAMRIQPAALAATYADVMVKAAVVACHDGARAVMQDLELHPVRFLGNHRVFINGTPTGATRFSTQPDNTYQNVLDFNFQYNASAGAGGEDQFVMAAYAPAILGAARPFKTVSVPAVHWSQVPGAGPQPCNFGGILGCELTGASFMLTTQFTRCAFGWTHHNNVFRACHISPAGGGPGGYPGGGLALARQLMANGAMTNAPNAALTVFGCGDGNIQQRGTHPRYSAC